MTTKQQIVIPDIGGASAVDVIEILVKPGDVIDVETPLVTLESDKASMEIPSPMAGVVEHIALKLGDKVSAGDIILTLSPSSIAEPAKTEAPVTEVDENPVDVDLPPDTSVENHRLAEPAIALIPEQFSPSSAVFAGPGVRRLAHEFGIDLNAVRGSGRKSRITKEDVQAYVKQRLSGMDMPQLSNVTAVPTIDFSQFGAIELKPLSKIKRLTGVNVHRSWMTVPHVTQFDLADITALEAFRKSETDRAKGADCKLTLLAFVCKVVSKALQVFPSFNASLDSKGEQLILKQYINIGIAVDTPNGLVVPVIKGVDQMSVIDIAKEMARLSAKARDKGLMPMDMSGGCFTISSLGGIGGTAFTPIVNSPEVAILGISRASMQPIFIDGAFQPRLMLPLSLSYDHRVIDGAEGARFTRFLAEQLEDIRRIIL